MDKVFDAIPEEWKLMVVFKREILEETVFVNFGDIGGNSTKVCELNDSLTKFCKLPIVNKSLLLVDPQTRFTRARYPNGNIEHILDKKIIIIGYHILLLLIKINHIL